MRVLKTLTVLSAILLQFVFFPVDAVGKKIARTTTGVSAGCYFSPRESGLGVSVYLSDDSFRDISIYLDYSDILDRRPVNPGFRFTYFHNLPIYKHDWGGFPFLVYAGPGVTLGYMHDRAKNDYGIIAGVSGDIGIFFKMWHNVSIGVGNQIDLAFKFGLDSSVNFFNAGAVFSYIPMIKVHYEF